MSGAAISGDPDNTITISTKHNMRQLESSTIRDKRLYHISNRKGRELRIWRGVKLTELRR